MSVTEKEEKKKKEKDLCWRILEVGYLFVILLDSMQLAVRSAENIEDKKLSQSV